MGRRARSRILSVTDNWSIAQDTTESREAMMRNEQIEALASSWMSDRRWKGIERPYSAEDVVRLRGSVVIEQTLARMGAEVGS